MRILGFSEHWAKLGQDTFSTFRFPRRDRDWYVNEPVQIIYKPRQKGGGEKLGIAEIIAKEPRWTKPKLRDDIPDITQEEAMADGFEDLRTMWEWILKTYDIRRLLREPMNKLTLRWLNETD